MTEPTYKSKETVWAELKSFLNNSGGKNLVEINISRQGLGKTHAIKDYATAKGGEVIVFTREHQHINQTLNGERFIHLEGFERLCEILNSDHENRDKVRSLLDLGVNKNMICMNVCTPAIKKVCPYSQQWENWNKHPVVAPYEFLNIPQVKEKNTILCDELPDKTSHIYFKWNEHAIESMTDFSKFRETIEKINASMRKKRESIDEEVSRRKTELRYIEKSPLLQSPNDVRRVNKLSKKIEKLSTSRKRCNKINLDGFESELSTLREILLDFLTIILSHSVTETKSIEEIKNETAFYDTGECIHVTHLVDFDEFEDMADRLNSLVKTTIKNNQVIKSTFSRTLKRVLNHVIKSMNVAVIKELIEMKGVINFVSKAGKFSAGMVKATMYERLELNGGGYTTSRGNVGGKKMDAWLSYPIPQFFDILNVSQHADKTMVMSATGEYRELENHVERFNNVNYADPSNSSFSGVSINFSKVTDVKPYKTELIEVMKSHQQGGRTKSTLIQFIDGVVKFHPDFDLAINLIKRDVERYGSDLVGVIGNKSIKDKSVEKALMRDVLRDKYGMDDEWVNAKYHYWGSSGAQGGRYFEDCRVLWILFTPHLKPSDFISKYIDVFNHLPPLKPMKNEVTGREYSTIDKDVFVRNGGKELVGYSDADLQFIFKLTVLNKITDAAFRLRKQDEETKIIKTFCLIPDELMSECSTHKQMSVGELFYHQIMDKLINITLPASIEDFKRILGEDGVSLMHINKVIELYARENDGIVWDKKKKVVRLKKKDGLMQGTKLSIKITPSTIEELDKMIDSILPATKNNIMTDLEGTYSTNIIASRMRERVGKDIIKYKGGFQGKTIYLPKDRYSAPKC